MARHSAVGHRPTIADQSALVGIACALAATFLFVFQDAGIKWITAELAVLQVLFVRSVIGLGYCGVTVLVTRKRPDLSVARPWLMIMRSLINVAAWLMFFTGLQYIDLGTALALFFTFPIFVTLLTGPFLGEVVGPRRWGAVVIGFIGAVIILDPSSAIEPAYLFIIGASAAWSVVAILTRKLAETEEPFVILIYTLAFFVAASAVGQYWFWQPISPLNWAMLAVIALGGFGAQFLIITAYSRASPATIAPFEYCALIWAAIIGYVIWGDVPSGNTIVGAVVIAASGLYIAHREARVASPVSLREPDGRFEQDLYQDR